MFFYFIVFRIQNVSMKIFFVSKYFFGCAWPIRARGYAWIWLDHPRSEDMLGYSHLGWFAACWRRELDCDWLRAICLS